MKYSLGLSTKCAKFGLSIFTIHESGIRHLCTKQSGNSSLEKIKLLFTFNFLFSSLYSVPAYRLISSLIVLVIIIIILLCSYFYPPSMRRKTTLTEI